MFDPNNKVMVPVPSDLTKLTPQQRTWTRFQEGERVNLKGVDMRIHEIGETRLVLKFD